jgi:hypothetical protein
MRHLRILGRHRDVVVDGKRRCRARIGVQIVNLDSRIARRLASIDPGFDDRRERRALGFGRGVEQVLVGPTLIDEGLAAGL